MPRQRKAENLEETTPRKPRQRKREVGGVNNLRLKAITPLSRKQDDMIQAYEQGLHVIASGAAGGGKGYIALFLALRSVLQKMQDKIIIIRTAVSCRPQGYMPGNIVEKEEIYSLPYKQIINDLFDSGTAYDELLKKRIIEFTTTSYLRGLTFDNAIVFFDEFQNASQEEIETVLTRLGQNSKVIFAGDLRQSDLYRSRDVSGFNWLINLTEGKVLKKYFKHIKFTFDDCVRSEFVKNVLMAIDMS